MYRAEGIETMIALDEGGRRAEEAAIRPSTRHLWGATTRRNNTDDCAAPSGYTGARIGRQADN
ncbi:MAG: hypothetical protein WBW74_28555 [Xanthobacteraceae bacterium]